MISLHQSPYSPISELSPMDSSPYTDFCAVQSSFMSTFSLSISADSPVDNYLASPSLICSPSTDDDFLAHPYSPAVEGLFVPFGRSRSSSRGTTQCAERSENNNRVTNVADSRRRCRMINGQFQQRKSYSRKSSSLSSRSSPWQHECKKTEKALIDEIMKHANNNKSTGNNEEANKETDTEQQDETSSLVKRRPPFHGRQYSALQLLLEIQRTGDRSLEFTSDTINTFSLPATVCSDDSNSVDDDVGYLKTSYLHKCKDQQEVNGVFEHVSPNDNILSTTNTNDKKAVSLDDNDLSRRQYQPTDVNNQFSLQQQQQLQPRVLFAKKHGLHLDIKRRQKRRTGFLQKLFHKRQKSHNSVS